MTLSSSDSTSSPSAREAPRWVLLAQEALARGFRNALAFRRWCRKRNVSIVTEGKFQWVNPADVDHAVDAFQAHPAPAEPLRPPGEAAVASAVTVFMMQKRKR